MNRLYAIFWTTLSNIVDKTRCKTLDKSQCETLDKPQCKILDKPRRKTGGKAEGFRSSKLKSSLKG